MFLLLALTVGVLTLGSCSEENDPIPQPEIIDAQLEPDDDEEPVSIPPSKN